MFHFERNVDVKTLTHDSTSAIYIPKPSVSKYLSAIDSLRWKLPNITQFTYSPLLRAEIRLLILTPGKKGSEIRVTLVHTLFESSTVPHYMALSYRWLGNTENHEVILNNFPFPVDGNLHDALQALRHPYQTRTIWIDAICIDQNDAGEKETQVQRMCDIYGSASMVYAWLGKDEDDSFLGLECLHHLVSTSGAWTDTDQFEDLITDPDCARGWEAMKRLFSRDYFRRGWILQELVLAQDTVLACGEKMIGWPLIEAFSGWLKQYSERPEVKNTNEFIPVLTIIRLQIDHRASKVHSLFNLLTSTWFCATSEPRDHIYSLLGISKPDDRKSIIPKYGSTSDKEIYAEAVKHMIRSGGNLDVLHRVFVGDDYIPSPSWIPEFTTRPRSAAYVGYNRIARAERMASTDDFAFIAASMVGLAPFRYSDDFSYRGAAPGMPLPVPEPTDPWEVLSLTGFIFDKVESAHGFNCSTEDLPLEQLERIAVDCLAKRGRHVHNGESVEAFEILWRTLIQDYLTNDLCTGGSEGGLALAMMLKKRDEMFRYAGDIPNFQPEEAVFRRIVETFLRRLSDTSSGSCFFATNKGYIGFGPRGMKDGDVLVVLYGADMPFVLREDTAQDGVSWRRGLLGRLGGVFPKRNLRLASKQGPARGGLKHRYRLLGPAYIHEVLNGELLATLNEGFATEKMFILH